MNPLRAMIIDDDSKEREILCELLNRHCPEVKIISKCSNGIRAKKRIADYKPDVVFLEVGWPNVSGFELLGSLSEKNFLLVIVSSDKNFGIHSVKANALDYLLRPINTDELKKSVNLLCEIKQKETHTNNNHSDKKENILLSQNKELTVLNVNDITHLDGKSNYPVIHLHNQKAITTSKTLKEFELRLPQDIFIRTHKSEIINLKYVDRYIISDNLVLLKCGCKTEVSRRRLQAFTKKLKECCS